MKRISVIVPETVENHREVAHEVARAFATAFGGYNRYEGDGGWIDENGKLVAESHIRVEAYGIMESMDYDTTELIFDALALVLKNQDCIFVEYDGTGRLLHDMPDIGTFVLAGRKHAV